MLSSLFLLVPLWAPSTWAYFADWSMLGGRPHEPTCVDIPRNMSLCSNIGYNKMRLPNLLDHDTLTEVQQQSVSWVPLLNVRCHPHTQLFLCSLFTPVCLESRIYPCKSLCNDVQKSCEARMRTYGYHWPDMLSCGKFPEDNDMCIKAPKERDHQHIPQQDEPCSACNPVETYENILDNFCRAKVVLRATVKRQRDAKVKLRRMKVLKSEEELSKKAKRKVKLLLGEGSDCCKFVPGKQKYLIMGDDFDGKFVQPTFVLPWTKSKSLKKAYRMFKKLNCSDPDLFSPTSEEGDIALTPAKGGKKERRMKNGQKGGQKKWRKDRKNNATDEEAPKRTRKIRRRKNDKEKDVDEEPVDKL